MNRTSSNQPKGDTDVSTKTSMKIAVLGAAVAGGAVVGALVAIPAVSSAQSSTATPAATASAAPTLRSSRVHAQTATTDPAQSQDPAQQDPAQQDPAQQDPAAGQGKGKGKGPRGGGGPQGGHVGANGTKEELLTGDDAAKVTAAAQAAVPGGTVERVETDAEGAAFEAHVTKADGSDVTVKFDANFNVTSTEDGHR